MEVKLVLLCISTSVHFYYCYIFSFESNRCRTAAGWIEIVKVRVPSGALPLSVECETRKGRDRIQSPDSPGRGHQRERSGGYMVESLPLIGSNYQRWLLSPIIHMTSIDSIPSPPGQHHPHSQCILQVNINPCIPCLPIWYHDWGPARVSAAWQWLDKADWHGLWHGL